MVKMNSSNHAYHLARLANMEDLNSKDNTNSNTTIAGLIFEAMVLTGRSGGRTERNQKALHEDLISRIKGYYTLVCSKMRQITQASKRFGAKSFGSDFKYISGAESKYAISFPLADVDFKIIACRNLNP